MVLEQHYKLHAEAKAHYLRCIELNPAHAGAPARSAAGLTRAAAYINLALMFKNVEKNLGDAEALLRKALEADADNAKALVNLGAVVQQGGGRGEEAATLYRRALALYGHYTSARVNLGLRCLGRGRAQRRAGMLLVGQDDAEAASRAVRAATCGRGADALQVR